MYPGGGGGGLKRYGETFGDEQMLSEKYIELAYHNI